MRRRLLGHDVATVLGLRRLLIGFAGLCLAVGWLLIGLAGLCLAVLRWLRRLRRLLIGFAGLCLVLLILWALVNVPPLILGVDQVQEVRQVQDPAKRLDEVNGLRTTLAAVLGGLAVAAGAIVGALNFRETSRQNRVVQEQNRAVLELQRRGQVTERFTKAIEQLGQRGDEKLDVRIGAVYALEQIARDSAELHWPIMEVLTAFLREHAPAGARSEGADKTSPRRPADQQAIATVLGRRSVAQDPAGQRLDLEKTDLGGAYLTRAHLGGAYLSRANLRAANLAVANLTAANLGQADLTAANLGGANLAAANLGEASLVTANLGGADLPGANLHAADLQEAHLAAADLTESYLGGANLAAANLGGANLTRAHLARANLGGANLAGANLAGAYLREVIGLTQEQLAVAWIEGASLPPGLAEQLAQGAGGPAAKAVPEADS